MKLLIISDLKSDQFLKRNIIRIGLFILIIVFLDNLLSFILLNGIERYYGINKDADILLIGHSHLMLSIDKKGMEQLTGQKVAKYTREGVNIADRQIMIKQYFEVCKKDPSVVVLGVDPWIFTRKGLSKKSYVRFYPFIDTPVVDTYLKIMAPNNFEYIKHKYFHCGRYDVMLINASIRGYLNNWENMKFGSLDTIKLEKEIEGGKFRRITFENENILIFSDILTFLESKKVRVILLNTPIYHSIIDVQNSEYQKAMQIISDQAAQHLDTYFIDLTKEFERDGSFFFDPIHMNPKGQRAVTENFSIKLNKIVIKKI